MRPFVFMLVALLWAQASVAGDLNIAPLPADRISAREPLRGIGFTLMAGGAIAQTSIILHGLAIERRMQDPHASYCAEWAFDHDLAAYRRLQIGERVMYGMIGVGAVMFGASFIIRPNSVRMTVQF